MRARRLKAGAVGLGLSALVGCGDGTTDFVVGTVTLSVNTPVLHVNQDLTVPPSTTDGGSTPALGGSAPALGGAVPAGVGTTPANTPATPSLDTLPDVGASTTAQSLLEAVTYTFSLVFSGLSSPDPACQLFQPYNGLDCSASGFTLTSSQLSGNSGVRVNLTETGAFGASNTVPVRIFSLSQFADTSGSEFATDAPVGAVSFNGALYYFARNSQSRLKLFKTDGTTVTQVANTTGNQATDDYDEVDFNGFLLEPIAVGSDLYFYSRNANGFYKLFRTNGTTVTQVSNTEGDNGVSDGLADRAGFEGSLYFVAQNNNGFRKLFKTDGTTVTQVSNTINDNGQHDIPDFLSSARVPPVAAGDFLYFLAKNTNDVTKLFKTDGTTVTQVSNTRNDQSTTDFPADNPMVAFENAVYFIAVNAGGFSKVYRDDGTTTEQVSNTRGNQGASDNATLLTPCGERLFFRATNQSGGTKLFQYNGATVTQVTDKRDNQLATDSIEWMRCVGDVLAFQSRKTGGGRALHYTDGVNVTEVYETDPGGNVANDAKNAIQYGAGFYFLALDGAGKAKFFVHLEDQVYQIANITDGEHDADTGIGGGGGHFLGVFNNRLYFTPVVDGDTQSVAKIFAFCDPSEGCE